MQIVYLRCRVPDCVTIQAELGAQRTLVDCASAVLEKSASTCSFLTIIRDEASGVVDDEMRRRMAIVVPHVRRAVLIGDAIDHKKAEAATFADTLDGLSGGMFLIAADGRIVHANAAGQEMLSAGDCLRSTSGRLVALDHPVRLLEQRGIKRPLAIAIVTAGIYANNTSLLSARAPGQPQVLAHRGLAQDFDRQGLTGETCTAARRTGSPVTEFKTVPDNM